MSITIVTHSDFPRLGWLGPWLESYYGPIKFIRAYRGDKLPPISELSSPVVVMGGCQMIDDIPTLKWLEDERDWVYSLITNNHPLLGICLGSQLMANAVGGEVRPCVDGYVECGYYSLQSTDLPSHVYHWHRDSIFFDKVSLPVEYLAQSQIRSGLSTHAFLINRAMGVQFHPEVDDEIIKYLLDLKCNDLSLPGSRARETHLVDHRQYGEAVRVWLKRQLKQLWNIPA